jgi:hypothetical protein
LLSSGLASLLSPTGLVIAGLAALAAGVYYVATANERAMDSYRELAKEANQLSATTQPLLARYQELSEKTNRTEAEQRELTDVIKQLADAVPGAVTEIDRYGQAVGISAERVSSFTAALQQQKAALAAQNLPDAQQKLQRLKTTYDVLQKAMEQYNRTGTVTQAGPSLGPGGGSVVATYKASAEAVATLRTQLANANVAFQQQTQLVAQLTGDAQGLGALRASIEPLGDLYAKLGGGQGAAAKSAGDTLKKLGEGSSEMAKAYAEVLKSFRLVGNESLALGDQFNYLQARQAADQAGIKKLIDAGYSPFSKAVQNLVGDLRNLNVTLGDNEKLSLRGLAGFKMPETPEFKLKLPEAIKLPEVLPMDLSGLSVDAEGLLAGYDNIQGIQANFSTQFTARQAEFNTNIGELMSQLGSSIGPLLADLAGQLGDAFGKIVTGTASASEAFGAAFSGILASIAGFMSDFGKQLVAIGIGKVALDSLFTGPQGGPLAIAAGVGLLALAGIAKAISSNASSSLKGIGGGGGASGGYSSPSTPNYGQGSNGQVIKVEAMFKLRGQDLVAVGRSQGFRSTVSD